MSPDSAALLTLGVLASSALAIAAWQIKQCGSLSIWTLTLFFRLYSMLWLSQRMQGRCPLPTEGGALLVGNHRSPADPMVIHSASLMKEDGYKVRVVGFLTAREYCQVGGVVDWIMRTAECIPVSRHGRDMGPVKQALRRLKEGEIVGIFPEGGIHQGPGLGEFDTGAAWLALRGGVPVYTVKVRNTPFREPIMSSLAARQPADAVFGPQVDLSRWDGQRPTPEVLHEVADYLRDVISRIGKDLPWPGAGDGLTPAATCCRSCPTDIHSEGNSAIAACPTLRH